MEIKTCQQWLDRQLQMLQPRMIVTLGRYSMARFFPGETISKIHGKARRDGDLVYFAMYIGDVDAIVSDCAACSGMLIEYAHLLHDDPKFGARALSFSQKIKDIYEWYDQIGLAIDRNVAERTCVTLHDACHLANVQGIRRPQRTLLSRIRAIRFMEMKDPSACCGSAGIYNITHPHMADKRLERKLGDIQATGAPVVVTNGPGCLLQLRAAVQERKLDLQVKHISQLVDRGRGARQRARQPHRPWLIQRHVARGRVIMADAVTMGVCGVVSLAAPVPDAVRYAACLAFSYGGGIIPPAVMSSTQVHARSSAQVASLQGLILQGSNVGQFAGPVAIAARVSATGDWAQAAWVFGVAAACAAVCGRVVASIERRAAGVPSPAG